MYRIGNLDKNMKEVLLKKKDGIKWYDPKKDPIKIAGLAFFDNDRVYKRLPLSSEKVIETVNKSVNRLSWNTSGVQMRFKTDSSKVCLKVVLKNLPMSYHMTAVMEGGFDCYVKYEGEEYQYISSTMIGRDKKKYETVLFEGLKDGLKDVIINFPLYGSVEEVYLGIPEDNNIFSAESFKNNGRIVAYGTSITQGGCANRPGMSYTNILSRRLDTEFINLGFSGNGKGEKEVIDIVANIENVSLFILDYEANAYGCILYDTLERAIDMIREKNPDVPILLVTQIRYSKGRCSGAGEDEFIKKFNFQKEMFEKKSETDKNIYFLDGSTLLGDCWFECTVDGVHPTDLGFYQMSNAIELVIRKILKV